MRVFQLFSYFSLVSSAALHRKQSDVKCPIIFDGRIPRNLTLSSFDSATQSRYSPRYVKGENLTWSEIIVLPLSLEPSRFDSRSVHKPFEVTISDASLFRSGAGLQVGFRRAGLLLKDDTNAAGSDAADQGIVTFHWSVSQDAGRPLNLSHEYMNVWHEKADYSGNQFTFVGGVVLKQDGGDGIETPEERESWKVQDAKNNVVFRTRIAKNEWQNFAIQLDHNNK